MMLQCPQFPENHNTAATAPEDMTVVEWHRARLKWLQQQQHQSYFTATPRTLDLHSHPSSILPASTAAFQTCSAFGDEEGASVAHDLASNMPPDLIHYPILGSSFVSGGEGSVVEGGDAAVFRTLISCPPAVGDAETKGTPMAPASTFDRGGGAVPAAAQYSRNGRRESWRKRKAGPRASSQEAEEDDSFKRTKGNGGFAGALMEPKLETPPMSSTSTTVTTATADGKDKHPPCNEGATSDTYEEKDPKVCEPSPKTDYIHVRARRGQATDSHSLAERLRREKISKRMKLLQDLVPGCNKITGKAGVLDEIINYVQSLQRQVEFLSMKLAAVSPTLDSNADAFFSKEIMQMIPHCAGVVPSLMGTPRPELLDASFLIHVNTMQTQQAVAAATAVECSGLDVALRPSSSEEQAALLRQTSARAPVPASECCTLMDTRKVRALVPTSPWEVDLDGLYTSLHELQQGLGRGPAAAAACGTSIFPMITNPSPDKF